jgi:hypothetical protein
MAEGRIIKKCISESKKLAELKSDSARLLYTWLIPHLDSSGRYVADPEIIKGHIVPKIKTMTISKIKQILDELADTGLIRLYKSNGEVYLELIKFAEFQKSLALDREPKSKLPAPDPDGKNEFRFKSGFVNYKSGFENFESASENYKSGSAELNLNKIKLNLNKNKREDNNTFAPTRNKFRSEPPPIFDFTSQQWLNITEELKGAWKEAYPACDIDVELLRMREWILSNPAKAKKKNWRRFIVNWLARTQERGGTRGANIDSQRRLEAIKRVLGGEE